MCASPDLRRARASLAASVGLALYAAWLSLAPSLRFCLPPLCVESPGASLRPGRSGPAREDPASVPHTCNTGFLPARAGELRSPAQHRFAVRALRAFRIQPF